MSDERMIDTSPSSLTPPGSPVLGYSGLNRSGDGSCGGENNYNFLSFQRNLDLDLDFEIDPPPPPDLSTNTKSNKMRSPFACGQVNNGCSVPIYCFSCKGPPRLDDPSFSPVGYLRRNEVISAIKVLQQDKWRHRKEGHSDFELLMDDDDQDNVDDEPDTTSSADRLVSRPFVFNFFGPFKFEPTKSSDLKIISKMCQKRFHALETLSKPQLLFTKRIFPTGAGLSSSKDKTQDPLVLRMGVVGFLNFIVVRRNDWRSKELEEIFCGLRGALGTVRDWTESVQQHCGSKDGNECDGAEYHLFHLNLEFRWSFLILFGLEQRILTWIIDDLLLLAHFKYKNSDKSLLERSPFNCYCVKELWTMISLVLDQLTPNGMDFWDVVTSALNRHETESDLLFPIWFLSHLGSVRYYESNGELSSSKQPDAKSAYSFINKILKQWISRSEKILEVQELLFRLLPLWGFDQDLVLTLWSHWLPKLDHGYGIKSTDQFSTITKWLKVIKFIHAEVEADDERSGTTQTQTLYDPYIRFLRLLCGHSRFAEMKDWRKLKSNLCDKLSQKAVSSFGEVGLVRAITIYLSLAFLKSDCQVMCERLNEVLNHAKDSLQMTVMRGRCTMILLLLEQSLNIESISGHLMRKVDEMMGSPNRSTSQRDLVMIYVEFISYLPEYGSNLELGQSFLISLNLTLWLTTCGPNYTIRTLRVLHSIFEKWIFNSESEFPDTQEKIMAGVKILEKTKQFLKQSIICTSQNQNDPRVLDLSPYADLAADLTVFQRLRNNFKDVEHLFDNFALEPRSSPSLSELYLARIVKSPKLVSESDLVSSAIPEQKLTQAWIRLVSCGCSVPQTLSNRIFGSNYRFSTACSNESSDILFSEFCTLAKEPDSRWNRQELQVFLQPLVLAARCSVEVGIDQATNPNGLGLSVIGSVVKSCSIALTVLKLEKFYIRNDQSSVVHSILDSYCPPVSSKPWKKLPGAVITSLQSHLPEFFIAITKYEPWITDMYLRRKLSDILRFAILGFVKSNELEDSNPGLVIMRFCEIQNNDPLLQEVSSSFVGLKMDQSLGELFLQAMYGFIKRKMIPTVVLFFQSVLELGIEKDLRAAHEIITWTCIHVISKDSYQNLRENLIGVFNSVMGKHFSLSHKRFFDLFKYMELSVKKYGRDTLFRFLHNEIVPCIQTHIKASEDRQGGGTNYALRNQLKQFEGRLGYTST